jgi:hypothetical protein
MKKLFSFIGASVLGWAGWAIGAPVGMVTAFIVSMIGTGLGMYFGVKLANRYLE